jgi:TRAP-type C4-dicarboxylate transport system permease small subunit
VDLLTSRLGAKSRIYFNLAHSVMGVAVSGMLCWYGTAVAWGQYQRGVVDIQVVDIPKYLILMIIPIGFFILVCQFLRTFLKDLGSLKDFQSPDSTAFSSSNPETTETRQ